ncbi:MAG: hypothetical protein Q4F33_01085 [Mycoplasmatota bacterium]|nr:hypothetical protein [Mycoplasmatota bacterium]
MKKRLIILLSLFGLLVSGCGNTNTPTSKVEEFLGKYQSMDSEVLTQLDNIISNDTSMSDTQKKDYQSLMEKQYQNLSYKIKDEKIDGDEAEVLVEIEVFDYANSILESKEYYNEHRDEFKSDDSFNEDQKDESGEVVGGEIDNIASFIDYKIKQLKDVTDKAKYEITFHLTKEDGEWVVEDISDEDRQKIHGLFEG